MKRDLFLALYRHFNHNFEKSHNENKFIYKLLSS